MCGVLSSSSSPLIYVNFEICVISKILEVVKCNLESEIYFSHKEDQIHTKFTQRNKATRRITEYSTPYKSHTFIQ